MGKKSLVQLTVALTMLAGACGRDALKAPFPDSGVRDAGQGGAAGIQSGSGGTGSGGMGGAGLGGSGMGGSGTGGGGGFTITLPDGGLGALLGDGGILGGILDAPRDNLLGQIICGPEVKTGTSCPSTVPGCVLESAGGACICLNGFFVCPASTGAPGACPKGAATGVTCTSILTTCIGGGATACICGIGTYTCF
jgi:hypothetical protein